MFDMHWYTMDLEHPWTWDRFARLCNFMQFTPYELASLVRLPHGKLSMWKEQNQIGRDPASAASASTVLLTIVEHTVMKGWTKDVIANPFPNMDSIHAVMADDKPQGA